MKYFCTYTENGITIDRENATNPKEAENWFRDSYNFHTDENADADNVNRFNMGQNIRARKGKTLMCWNLNFFEDAPKFFSKPRMIYNVDKYVCSSL